MKHAIEVTNLGLVPIVGPIGFCLAHRYRSNITLKAAKKRRGAYSKLATKMSIVSSVRQSEYRVIGYE